MKIEHMIGKTILGIARVHDFRLKGWRVYWEPADGDRPTPKVAEDYSLKKILHDHPELKGARVCRAEEYFGIIILRVKEKRK